MNVSLSDENTKTVEGTLYEYIYTFIDEESQGPSWLQLFKNFENALKKIGATTLYNDKDGIAFFYLKKDKMEIYFKIQGSGGNSEEYEEYYLEVIEIEAMQQEVSSTDIFKNLEKDGFFAIDIQFETGKFTIKEESFPLIDAIVEMMKNNQNLNISVDGHTDNVGDPASNMTLSQNRAQAVMNAIIAKGIDKKRLSAKGYGSTIPLADNRSEEGRAKNRRVELVKK